MAIAHKCDVVNCNQIDEGQAAGIFVAEALGVRKELCQQHTDEVVSKYFPDLLEKVEVASVEQSVDGQPEA